MRKRGFYISPCVKCGKSNIEDILNNPVYMGDFMWAGKHYYNAKHEPIVSRELYYLCQKVIKQKTTTSRDNKMNFLFTGLIKCEVCGCSLVGDCKRRTYLKEKHAEEIFLGVLESLKVS